MYKRSDLRIIKYRSDGRFGLEALSYLYYPSVQEWRFIKGFSSLREAQNYLEDLVDPVVIQHDTAPIKGCNSL